MNDLKDLEPQVGYEQGQVGPGESRQMIAAARVDDTVRPVRQDGAQETEMGEFMHSAAIDGLANTVVCPTERRYCVSSPAGPSPKGPHWL